MASLYGDRNPPRCNKRLSGHGVPCRDKQTSKLKIVIGYNVRFVQLLGKCKWNAPRSQFFQLCGGYSVCTEEGSIQVECLSDILF